MRPVQNVTEILGQFGLTPLEAIKKLDGAVRNETWIVQTQHGKKVLKRYKPSLEYNQLLYEHSILDHLAEKGFPAPRLAHTHIGETLVQKDGRYYSVFDYLDHYIHFDNYIVSPHQKHQFLSAEGRALGQLHKALEGFNPDGTNVNGFLAHGDRGVGLDWYLAKLNRAVEKFQSSPDLREQPDVLQVYKRLDRVRDESHQLEEQLHTSPLRKGVVHGDYGPHNVIFQPGQPVVVLDFELARLDWCIVDLVSAFSHSVGGFNADLDLRKILPILSSYHKVYPLPEEDYQLLPSVWKFQSLRRLMFSWSEYIENGKPSFLAEAKKRSFRLDWLSNHWKELSCLYERVKEGN